MPGAPGCGQWNEGDWSFFPSCHDEIFGPAEAQHVFWLDSFHDRCTPQPVVAHRLLSSAAMTRPSAFWKRGERRNAAILWCRRAGSLKHRPLLLHHPFTLCGSQLALSAHCNGFSHSPLCSQPHTTGWGKYGQLGCGKDVVTAKVPTAVKTAGPVTSVACGISFLLPSCPKL